jgi:5'-nucleotidase/UDP-sugar diphosphatase
MKHNHLNRREFLQISALYGAGVALAACTPDLPDFSERQTDTLRNLTVIYTNDEHGWMERTEQYGGAAGMLHQWRRQAGYTRDGPFLVLSGGDMWTGPALSTWFKGESMVNVMNAMGYNAATIGNHDFDFGVEVLRQRAAQANFPFLSANIREKATGKTPDFLRPYVIQEINELKVGLIGLTTLDTPVDTIPANVVNFDFLPYKDTLREVVPKVKADGGQVILLLGHLCTGEMRSLASAASELGIPILCAGHCHEETIEQDGEVTIVQSGSFLHKFIRIALLYDKNLNRLVEIDTRLLDNPGGGGDSNIDMLVKSWHDRADPDLWKVIGIVGQKIDAETTEMTKLLTNSWLDAYPLARIALFSPRYVQSLPAGEVSEASILSMLPTDNELVDVMLTGAQILETLDKRHPSVGGLSEMDGKYILSDGSLLEPLTSYHVLIPDSLYEGENNYDVRRYDPNGTYTGVDWRAPVVSWVRRLNTSDQTRLESYLNP